MEVLRNVILSLCVLCVFAFAYFLMTQLDKFLEENRKTMKKEDEKREPSCVMLTGEVSDEEIVEELRRFRNRHNETCIILYGGSDTELSKSIEEYNGQNR